MIVLNTTERPAATSAEACARALKEYRERLGQTVQVHWLYGCIADQSFEWRADPPFVVRVLATDAESVTRFCDEFLDPYWNVEVLDGRGVAQVAEASSLWIHGPSFEVAELRRK